MRRRIHLEVVHVLFGFDVEEGAVRLGGHELVLRRARSRLREGDDCLRTDGMVGTLFQCPSIAAKHSGLPSKPG